MRANIVSTSEVRGGVAGDVACCAEINIRAVRVRLFTHGQVIVGRDSLFNFEHEGAAPARAFNRLGWPALPKWQERMTDSAIL